MGIYCFALLAASVGLVDGMLEKSSLQTESIFLGSFLADCCFLWNCTSPNGVLSISSLKT